jgi:hypothetical protein
MARQRLVTGKSGIELDTSGVREQVRILTKMGARGADARDAFPRIEAIMLKEEKELFESNDRGTWPGLKESTKERKAYAGHESEGIMRATNALMKSLTNSGRPRGRFKRQRKQELRWGTKVFYAFFHQEGHGVPVRKVIDPSEKAQAAMTKALGKHIAYGK